MDELKLTILRKGNFGSFRKPVLEKIESHKKLQERLKKEKEEEEEKKRLEEIERNRPKFYQCIICMRKFELNEHHKYRRHIDNLHKEIYPTVETLIEKIQPTYEVRFINSAITTRHSIIFVINLLQVEVFGIDTYRFFVIFINDIDKYLKLPLLYYNYWNLDRQLLKIFNENISISVDLLPLMKRTEYQYKPTEGEVKAINNFIDEQMKEVRINDLLIEHNKLEKKMKEIENENELLKSTLNIWKIDTDKEKGNVILRFMRRVIARKKLKEYPEWEHNLSEITNKN